MLSPPPPPCGERLSDDRVRVPAGTFRMGTDRPLLPQDGEGPSRRVRLPAFRIDRHAVSNARFAAFVEATGHRTDAQRYGWSFVFHAFVPEGVGPTRGVPGAPWWRQVHGATWWRPEGPGSDVQDRWDHPAVHVSWN
ncbi:MAG: SUMF1/EgtB/PvdO family nonheme iron enzyme, partial [Trueperaceae bacterium]